MNYNYAATPGLPGSGFTVSVITTGTPSQRERREFLTGVQRGMTQVGGARIIESQGFEHAGNIPDRFEVSFVIEANGARIYARGLMNFGKKRTTLVNVLAPDSAKRDELMQYVPTYKDL